MKLLAVGIAGVGIAIGLGTSLAAGQTPMNSAFTYQGQVREGGEAVNGPLAMAFSLWDGPGGDPPLGGTQLGTSILFDGSVAPLVDVTEGLFSVTLNAAGQFGPSAFNGQPRWLQIHVDGRPLAPRQPITAAPYAAFAAGAWNVGGNAGTEPASHFLGTSDAQPLELRVNNQRAMRFESVEDTDPNYGYATLNVLGGHASNEITPGAPGATIAGGGADFRYEKDGRNRVTAEFGTIGGGFGNTVEGLWGTIAGGAENTCGHYVSTIAGGWRNVARGGGAVAGGEFNEASGTLSGVLGGYNNRATNAYAYVLGGAHSHANGYFSFAAGRTARAHHDGACVWADHTPEEFHSTGPDQFLIRSSGGVGINTNAPGSSLQVNGGVRARGGPPGAFGASNNGYAFAGNDGDNDSGMFSTADGRIELYTDNAERLRIDATGNVSIGTTDAQSFRLAVNGSAAKPGGGDWSVYSDARLKRDIRPMRGTLDKLLLLHGYEFEYTPEAVEKKLALPGRHIGLIAQEVQQVFPDWVECDDEGYLQVTERATTALLVEALRELRVENEALRAANEGMLTRLERLESLLSCPSTH